MSSLFFVFAATALVAKLGGKAEVARALSYWLYILSERKKRAAEELFYNGLVQSWSEITRRARDSGRPGQSYGNLCVSAEGEVQ